MPSPIAHTAVGYVLYRIFQGRFQKNGDIQNHSPALLAVASGMSLLPDMDAAVGLALGDMGGIHNNASHSLVVSAGVAAWGGALAARERDARFLPWFLFTLSCYGSHVLMDFFSSRRGVMLLWPFTSRRFLHPVKLFYGLRWNKPVTDSRHVLTIITEAAFVLLILIGLNLPSAANTLNAMLDRRVEKTQI
jgi:membrane-bound metal-dependent hydrolase YbcI (DUF457 family)